jgi:hypothetical protein
MKHKQKQIVIYITQVWAMPLFTVFIIIGKIAQGVEWVCQNGIDIMNDLVFIPSMKFLDKHIKDTK